MSDNLRGPKLDSQLRPLASAIDKAYDLFIVLEVETNSEPIPIKANGPFATEKDGLEWIKAQPNDKSYIIMPLISHLYKHG